MLKCNLQIIIEIFTIFVFYGELHEVARCT